MTCTTGLHPQRSPITMKSHGRTFAVGKGLEMKNEYSYDWTWFTRLRVGEVVYVPEIGLPRNEVINAAQQFYRMRHDIKVARRLTQDSFGNPVMKFTRTA